MPQCQFLFSGVFGSRKAVREIFSEFDETKAKPPIFPRDTQSQKGKPGGGPRPPPHRAARPGPQARRGVGSPPRDSTDIAPLPIYSPTTRKPEIYLSYSRKTPGTPPPSRNLVSGVRSSCFGTLPGPGLTPGAFSIDAIASIMLRE